MAMLLERDRKLVEAQVKDMHTRLDDAENNALKVKTCVMIIKSQKIFILYFFISSTFLVMSNLFKKTS
jgi:hypothetical protein